MRMRLAGEVQGLKDVQVRLDFIDDQLYLENVIAYILRNPIAAGIWMMPYHYRWSSISLYFRGDDSPKGTRIGDLSNRQRFRILKSRLELPGDYMMDDQGMILPSCYVDSASVEKIFGHPARLMMALARKIENDVELKFGVANDVTMTDQEILTQMKDLIKKEFGKDSISQLSAEQRISLCLMLKRNFRAGVKQIARLTRIDPAVVAKIV